MTKILQVLATIAVLAIGVSAQAGPILYVSDSSNHLGTVDVATGATIQIGNMGVTMTDIAFDPTGHLFGVDFSNLYLINPTTAAVTLIGPMIGLNSVNALVFGSDGTLYAANGSSLWSVDPTTAALTFLGDMGFSSGGDLAFNGGDLFLATSSLLVKVGLSPVSGTPIGLGFGFSNVFGLATGDDGVLYGVSGHDVFSVDTTTGAGTYKSTYNAALLSDAYGSSFFKEAAPEVPEPTTVGLLGLGLAATRLLRNRKPS